MKKPGKRPRKAAKKARSTAPAADARKLLIDELGDIGFVDTLLMKLWFAGYKLVLIENDDGE